MFAPAPFLLKDTSVSQVMASGGVSAAAEPPRTAASAAAQAAFFFRALFIGA